MTAKVMLADEICNGAYHDRAEDEQRRIDGPQKIPNHAERTC
jgi:hypothetical protein